MRLAINNDVMNAFLHARNVDRMFLGKPVVPTAVPDPEEVGVFLVRSGQLRAGKLLNIDVAFGIGVFGKLRLSGRTAYTQDQCRADYSEVAIHLQSTLS